VFLVLVVGQIEWHQIKNIDAMEKFFRAVNGESLDAVLIVRDFELYRLESTSLPCK